MSFLPSKIANYLRRLRGNYRTTSEKLLFEILDSARFFVREETSYDNWNGGTYGHDVVLFLTPEILDKIPLHLEPELRQQLCSDLNSCAQSIENENIGSVVFELADQEDSEFQKSRPIAGVQQIAPETVSFWKPGLVRAFVSHRDSDKVGAREFGDAIEKYGISTFVAHDTIEPMSSWRDEILKGLKTMEVMIALVTEAYHESEWTNQEVGYALGKEIPVVAIQLGPRPPGGFLAATQAIKGSLANPADTAAQAYSVLAEKLGNRDRLQGAIVRSFVESPDWDETRKRFDFMSGAVSKLSDVEVEQICEAYRRNDAVGKAYYLGHYDRLQNFLNRCTGRVFEVDFKTRTAKAKL